ncbi:GyrI-like domain-containing protein [Flavobacterium sp.]|uniref:GyrI-like domain-containing protein n=1 Tax=Flavobacterium sp. TaxID=239 RepID=UPI002632F407|nr:GyrI-like domain-containing protein [Flavobacterium sp.]
MIPKINILPEKKLVGKRITMTLLQNKTFELWQSFMPFRNQITNAVGSDKFSMQVYAPDFDFNQFTPQTIFEKWAAIEVSDFLAIPENMEPYVLKGGLYAVFNYKGKPENGSEAFHYIFKEWLPNSIYEVDKREHFEILGDKYIRDNEDSEEEIWVPIKLK